MTMNLAQRVRRPAFWIALLGLTAAWSCADNRPGGTGTTPPPGPPAVAPARFVVAVDLSTSLTAAERASHEALLHALANELDFGDRLVLLQATASGVRNSAPPRPVSVPMPRGQKPLQRDHTARDLARQTADRYVTTLFRSPPSTGTDLFATLHTAGEQVREGGGARTMLVILSDMLQCADGVCMERRDGVPDSAWIAARKAQSLVPSLEGACVTVVGADASTAHGVRVREFWRRYFRAAGASFSPARYMHGATSPATLRCDR
ncbi:MAG TPA: hypothetical protein VK358_10050 [Longimicrobium sp.]|nr:hypothetical protein [Longimicrobium sp.]